MRIEHTGQITTALLLISAFSGFVLAYQYEAAEPFIASTAIETVIPFGAFWRSLHFWSSQAFFLVLVLHVWQSLGSISRFCSTRSGRIHWAMVSFTVPLALYALFSGYVLRFDGTGQAAGTIAEHLFLAVPLIGEALDRLFMGLSDDGLNRIYAVHILFTVLCWGIGTWYHTRRVLLQKNIFISALAFSMLTAYLLHAPVDLPGQNLHLIKGPWFFLGIQELLRHLAPLAAGITFPMIPLVTLALLPWWENRRNAYFILAAWLAVYAGATMIALFRQ